jgi:hypothetical protein
LLDYLASGEREVSTTPFRHLDHLLLILKEESPGEGCLERINHAKTNIDWKFTR